MYISRIKPYTRQFFHSMYLIYSLFSRGPIYSKISIFIHLAFACCNPTKSVSWQSPWGAPITDTKPPRATPDRTKPLRPHPRWHWSPTPWQSPFTNIIDPWNLMQLIPRSWLSSLPISIDTTRRTGGTWSLENHQECRLKNINTRYFNMSGDGSLGY